MPSPPKKTPQNKLQKMHFPKSAKTSHVGMLYQQKTLPQKAMKQATMHTGRHAQTTHTSQRDAFTAYLPSLAERKIFKAHSDRGTSTSALALFPGPRFCRLHKGKSQGLVPKVTRSNYNVCHYLVRKIAAFLPETCFSGK